MVASSHFSAVNPVYQVLEPDDVRQLFPGLYGFSKYRMEFCFASLGVKAVERLVVTDKAHTVGEPFDDVIDRPPEQRAEDVAKPKKPPLYRVILHNDHYTPRGFVVEMLKKHFNKGEEEARRIMLSAHQLGLCVVGVWTRDVAETKIDFAMKEAKENQHPLQFTCEKDT